MNRISYVNGSYIEHDKATVSIDDRGYQFADGVYEVAFVKKGVFLDWQEHCQRLQRSLDGLQIKYKVSEKELEKITRKLMKENGLADAVMYLQITRGVAKRDHRFPNPAPVPSVVMTVSKPSLPTDEQYTKGVDVITYPDIRWKRRDYKTISLLPNVIARQKAEDEGVMEAVFVEDNGVITEGSSTNFFIIDDKGNIKTHPANESILGGVTRNGVIKAAKGGKLKVVEKAFFLDDAMNAKEAFITSTTKHVLPVVKIDGKKIGNGKPGVITKQLIDLYKCYINKQIDGK